MSLSSAERAGIAGALLLAGGIVSAGLIFLLWGGQLRGPAPRGPDGDGAGLVTPAGEPPAVPEPGKEPPAAEPPIDPDETDDLAALRREIRRLKNQMLERDRRIADLEARLMEAGIPVGAEEKDPAEVAAAALADLRACGPETSPTEIDVFVERLVHTGNAGVEVARRFLEHGQDVSFADAWQYIGGRFTAYPSLRIALFDALGKIGGVEGQAALVGLLRQNEDPLETLVLLASLADIAGVPTVEEARLQAARRYVEGPPARRELLFRPYLIRVFAAEPPEYAVRDLEALANRKGAPAESAEAAYFRIAEMDAPEALDALARAAARPEGGAIAQEVGELLASRPGRGAVARLGSVLDTAAPAVRQAVYGSLAPRLRDELRVVRRQGARGGLEALDRLDRIEREREARAALLEGRKDAEPDPDARRALDEARKTLADLADRIEAVRSEIRGE